MGRAARWLRSLLGGKKDSKEQKDGTSTAFADERREKKRWSFKYARDSGEPAATGSSTAWLRSLYAERVKEQSKHAIGAAMAAAANATVVQLSSNGRKTKIVGFSEWLAAVKIQRVFRGYLAKKALRALKALVKLQALVRGYLVRKQAAATFYSMQALIKVQATVRAKKCRAIFSSERTNLPKTPSFQRHRLSSRSSRRPSYSVKDPCDEIFPISISSPLPNIGRISVPDSRFTLDKCRYSVTAQSTPRCFMPSTPARSTCGMAEGEFRRRFINSMNCPNYMNKTQSFEAKKRSQSAPKQRPEVPSKTKRLPLSELVIEQSRASLSSIRTRKIEEEFSFKRAVVGRLDRSLELNRNAERDFYLQMKR